MKSCLKITLLIIVLIATVIISNVLTERWIKRSKQPEIIDEIKLQKNEDSGVIGQASWYDYKINDSWWSLSHRTAASRDLPRYSYAKVTNLDNGKSVIVFINDYGPEEWTGRKIDLSSHAFSLIANNKLGVINVKIEPYYGEN